VAYGILTILLVLSIWYDIGIYIGWLDVSFNWACLLVSYGPPEFPEMEPETLLRMQYRWGAPDFWYWPRFNLGLFPVGLYFIFPFWLLYLPLIPIVVFGRRRRRRGSDEPLCSACGYSLRGNVSGRCPECGTRP